MGSSDSVLVLLLITQQWKRSLAGVGPTLAPPLRSNIRNNNAMPTAEACITVSNLNTEMPRPLVDDTSTSGCIASSAVPSDTVALGSVPTVSQLSLALRRPSKEHGSLVNLYRDLIEPGADADESKKSPLRRSSSVRLDADQPSLAKDTLRRTSSMRLDQRLRSAVIVPLAKLRVTAPFVLCNMGVDIMAKERHLSGEDICQGGGSQTVRLARACACSNHLRFNQTILLKGCTNDTFFFLFIFRL